MNHLKFLVRTAGPNGIERSFLILRYADDTGLSEGKAEEHLDMQIALNTMYEDDLSIFWRGDRESRDQENKEIEEERNRSARAHAEQQKALGLQPPPEPDKSQPKLDSSVIPGKHPETADTKSDTATRKGTGMRTDKKDDHESITYP